MNHSHSNHETPRWKKIFKFVGRKRRSIFPESHESIIKSHPVELSPFLNVPEHIQILRRDMEVISLGI